MSYTKYQSCIDACYACAVTSEHCASACLHEPNVQAMADCIMLNIDCAEICRLAASYMARDSVMMHAICEACAEVCERCQEECSTYQMDHCKACVEACRRCAQECRLMASTTDGGHIHNPEGNLAGFQ